MAQHNKATDPVSQAMLAIEDALSLGLEGTASPDSVARDADTPAPAAKEPDAKAPATSEVAARPDKVTSMVE